MKTEKHLNELRKLDNEIYLNLDKASQKLIDIIQETMENFDIDYSQVPIKRRDLGAISYEIEILLEIWNPNLKYDIEVLKRFNEILNDWIKEVDSVSLSKG